MTEVISMEDVGYSYRPGTWLFRHYNATIKRGQVLAILDQMEAEKQHF